MSYVSQCNLFESFLRFSFSHYVSTMPSDCSSMAITEMTKDCFYI